MGNVSQCFRTFVVVLCLHFGSFTISLGHSPGEKSSVESYVRLRTSRTANREWQKRRQVGWRLVVELAHLQLFHITTNSYHTAFLWNIPARCMWIRMYQTILFLQPTACLNRLQSLQKIHTYTSSTAQIIQNAHHLHFDVKNAYSKLLLLGPTIHRSLIIL